MTGKNNGFIACLKQNTELHCEHLMGLHCIIHVEALCAKFGSAKLKTLLCEVTQIINYIRGRALVHRQFRSFLETLDT